MSIWENINSGEITCDKHAGSYLSCGIQAKPRNRRHITPLGTWARMSDAEMAEFAEFLLENGAKGATDHEGNPLICEACRDAR